MAFMATPEGAMLAVVIANWWRGFPFFGVSYLAHLALDVRRRHGHHDGHRVPQRLRGGAAALSRA
jgi:hypothetical protein